VAKARHVCECEFDGLHETCQCVDCGEKWPNGFGDHMMTVASSAAPSEREQFEKWVVSQMSGWKPAQEARLARTFDDYNEPSVQYGWMAWQAARAAAPPALGREDLRCPHCNSPARKIDWCHGYRSPHICPTDHIDHSRPDLYCAECGGSLINVNESEDEDAPEIIRCSNLVRHERAVSDSGASAPQRREEK
jgi:hypothetical protein